MSTNKYNKLSYAKCGELLAGKDHKKLAHNTYLVRAGDEYHVMYHSTAVIRFYADESFSLHTGGYRTTTTKQRLNWYSGVSVWQEKGEWYTSVGEFSEGMRIALSEVSG